jgi:hypothetical protein
MPKTKTIEIDGEALRFNAEAVRSYLFKAALDVADQMQKDGIAMGEAAILTGAIEMVAQLWAQVGHRAGQSPSDVRHKAERQFWIFYHRHLKTEREQAQEAKPS